MPITQVPYVELANHAKTTKEDLVNAFWKVVESGQYILGPELAAFEKEFAGFCTTKFAIGMDNGTSALHIVFRNLGLKPGDEIITVPNSFIATVSSIVLAGFKPVFVDVGADLNMDPQAIEKAITKKTKIILPVHLTGRPARMTEILKIAKKRSLIVIEDAAQAIGAKLNGQKVGGMGHAGCFSLHPLKNLYAFGDGGMVTTHDENLSQRLLKARNHGLRNRDECEFWSYNCRLDELQAALLRVQFKHLEKRTQMRRKLAFRYNKCLKPFVVVPEEGPGETCVYQTYMIQTDRRDELKRTLNENGVQVSIHYPIPIHLQQAAKALGYKKKDFPMAEKLANRILSLPVYPGMSQQQQNQVIELIEAFHKGKK